MIARIPSARAAAEKLPADLLGDILYGPREQPAGRQCLHCAEQRACANQRDELVHNPKREEPGEDLVGRKARVGSG